MKKKEKKSKLPEIADKWCKSVTQQIMYIPDRSEIYCELAAHIEDIAADYSHYDNVTEDEAYAKAVEHMGDAEEVGRELNEQHKLTVGILLTISKIASVAALIAFVVSLVYGAVNFGFLWDDNYMVGKYELFEHKDLEKLYEFSLNKGDSKQTIDMENDVYYYYMNYDSQIILVSDSDAPIYNIERLDIIEPYVSCEMCDFRLTFNKVKVGTMPEFIPEIFADIENVELWRDYICQLDISAITLKPWGKFDFLRYVEIYDDKGDKVDFEYEIQRNSAWSYEIKMEMEFENYKDKRPQYVDFTFDKGDYDVSMRIPLIEGEEDAE